MIHFTKFSLIFLFVFFGTNTLFSQKAKITKENFHLYLLAGQSNMAGRGIVEPQDTVGNPRILKLNRNGEWEIAREPLHFDKSGAGVGPGLAFARELLTAADDNVVIGLIPCAAGGSGIDIWLNDLFWEQTKSVPYNNAVLRTKLAMKSGVLKGILWHQGEADCGAKKSEVYAEKLIALVKKLSLELNTPNVPFIAGELPEFQSCSENFNPVLHQVKSFVKNYDVASGKGLTSNPDNIHLDAASARKLGIRYAEKLKQIQNKKGEYKVLDYGAVGDGETINTSAIQNAIDECSNSGGGKVIIPQGVFLSGTLYMKNNVNLFIDAEATLKGSPSFKDYPDNSVHYHNSFSHPGKPFGNKAFIFGEALQNISITGTGTIDGNGYSSEFQLGNDATAESRARPSVICFIKCNNVKVEGLRLQNSAYWMQNYIACDTLVLSGLNIHNHCNYNQDGMDIDASNVLVENCSIDSDDDGVCLKSHNTDRIVENVSIRNCTIGSNCNAIKFGTKSDGGFRNIRIENCKIQAASESKIRNWQNTLKFIEKPVTVLAGLAFESVDGGIIENIEVSDLEMQDVQTPIFVILGRRNIGQAGDPAFYNGQTPLDTRLKAGKAVNLSFKNITATSHSKMASSITASAGNYVENVSFDNVKISTMGNGTADEAAIVLKEYAGSYPENRMYGQVYPSSALFFRHVKNVSLKNVELTLRNEDYRPSIIFDDAHNVVLNNLNDVTFK
ncbi:MAG: hypothetical protein LBU22_02060 [Dysgonamonadaceae bacterium]|jgi:polygalacturonase|nr:hypothetical protein [Dysgonamonadaceae bacterium]